MGDSVPLTVEVLNRAGDVIPGAAAFLVSLTPDTIRVDATGLGVVGVMAGPGDVLAGVQNLRSLPFRIVVRAP